jgi:hypothetical protein
VEVRKESHAIKLVSLIDIVDSFTYPSIVARTPANLRTIRPTTLKLLNQQITLEVKHAKAAEFEQEISLNFVRSINTMDVLCSLQRKQSWFGCKNRFISEKNKNIKIISSFHIRILRIVLSICVLFLHIQLASSMG